MCKGPEAEPTFCSWSREAKGADWWGRQELDQAQPYGPILFWALYYSRGNWRLENRAVTWWDLSHCMKKRKKGPTSLPAAPGSTSSLSAHSAARCLESLHFLPLTHSLTLCKLAATSTLLRLLLWGHQWPSCCHILISCFLLLLSKTFDSAKHHCCLASETQYFFLSFLCLCSLLWCLLFLFYLSSFSSEVSLLYLWWRIS